MRVGIVGFGVIGREVGRAIIRAHEKDPTIESPIYFDIKTGNTTREEFNENVDIAFICVPTPTDIGEQDLSAIEETLKWLTVKNVCIRSTILPGTTEKLLLEHYPKHIIVYSPEFIGEKDTHPYRDFSPFQIIGYDNLKQKNLASTIADLYMLSYPNAHICYAPSRDAEFFKYTCNIFLAMKVIFSNLMADEAVTRGVDWDKVTELLAFDKRIGSSHTVVTQERGFGGSCLPKDLDAFMGMLFHVEPSRVNGSLVDFLSMIKEINHRIRR